MARMRRWAGCCAFAVSLLGPAAMPGADDRDVGYNHYSNREFELAVASFVRLLEREPEDPVAHVLLSKALLYQELGRLGIVGTGAFRGDEQYRNVAKPKPNAQASKRILATLERGMRHCEQILERDADDRTALHSLAQLYALRAGHELMVAKAYLKALASGRRAKLLSYRVGELYPDFPDGLLVAGIYEYTLGSVPWAVKALIALSGYRGKKKQGAEIIARVAELGRESRYEARLLLALTHRKERRYLAAAEAFQALADDFPRAYSLRLEAADLYESARKRREALHLFQEVRRKRASGADRYNRIPERVAAALDRRIADLEQDLEKTEAGSCAAGWPAGLAQAGRASFADRAASAASFADAAPESIASQATAAHSGQLSARPAMRSALAEFMTTISRAGPRCPDRTDRIVEAFA